MRKLLLALSAATVASVASASVNMEYQWWKSLDAGTAVQSMVYSIAEAPAGDYYMAGGFAATTSVDWGGTDITPAQDITTNYQRDWTLARIDAYGNLRWHITSPDANIAQNYQYVRQTPDGGVVMLANATFNKNGEGAPTLMTFTDAKGTTTTLTWENPVEGKSPFAGVVLKFTADGEYQWSRVIPATLYEAEGTFNQNAVSFRALAVDGDGNIYAGGQYLTALKLSDTETSPYAINLGVEYNGKTYNNGDVFIARLDSEGNTTGFLTNKPDAPYAMSETLGAITVNGGNLYCAVLAQGIENRMYSLFGVDAEISATAAANIVYGKIDLNSFTCTDAKALEAATTTVSKSHTAMIQNIQLLDGTLFICGSNNGALKQNGNTLVETTVSKLESMIIAIDPATMEATRSYNVATGNIGNIYGAIHNAEEGKLYGVGYQMGINTADLYEFNTADGTLESTNALGVGAGSMCTPVFNNDTKQLLFSTYSKQLTALAGTGENTDSYGAFHGIVLSTRLPDVTSAIAAATAADADAPVEYYSLQGIRLTAPAAGTIVIRRQGTEVSKVLVK